ncbi:MAG: DUF4476 domain-containing protein [Hymenobacter sp.]|nr:MAG: DUF4476 domain-containing protein [Hymenobacter sp.]
MKALFILAASGLLTYTAVAAPAPPATANFTSERGQVFSLVLDGRLLTRPLARQVRVGQLPPGQHWADFSLPTAYGPLRFRTAVWLQPGMETSYVVVVRPGYGPQLRQVGAVALYGPAAYGPGSYGGGYPPQPRPGGPYGSGPGGAYNGGGYNNDGGAYGGGNAYPGVPGNVPYGGQNGGYGSAPAPAYPGGYGPGRTAAPGNPTGTYPGGQANGDYNQGAPGGRNQNMTPLQPADVQNLTQDLRGRASDEERMDLAKQALNQNTVRADELTQLINTLDNDEARIDLAEYGYEHVSDPASFYRVYGALRSPANVREVQQALGLPQR